MHEIKAHVAGSLWRLLVGTGDAVDVDDEVAIIESMKMEIPLESEFRGTVIEVLANEGDQLAEDQIVIRLQP